MHYDSTQYILMAVILLVSYYIRGIAGYGSGLLAIPLMALFLPLEVVVPYVSALDYLAALGHGLHHRRSVQWKEIAAILPLAVTAMGFALYLFTTADKTSLKVWLGIFIIVYAVYSLFPTPQFKGSRIWVIPFATLGGVVDSLFGTGGPIYVIYLRLRQLEKTPFVATIAMAFMINSGFRLIAYFAVGFYSLKILWMILLSLPLVFIGMRLGMQTHTKLSARQFNLLISVLLILAGSALLLRV